MDALPKTKQLEHERIVQHLPSMNTPSYRRGFPPGRGSDTRIKFTMTAMRDSLRLGAAACGAKTETGPPN